MGWWDLLTSWMDGFWDNIDKIKAALWGWVDDIAQYWVRNITAVSGAIDSIKYALWSWVDGIAKYWVQRADDFFDILRHSWDDVRRTAESIAGDVVRNADQYFDILRHTWGDVADLVEKAKSYADDIVTDLALKVDNWIRDIGETIPDIWQNLKPYVEQFTAGLVESVDKLLEDMTGVKNWIDSFVDNLKGAVGNVADEILEGLVGLGSDLLERVLKMDVPFEDLVKELEEIVKE